VNVIIIIGDPIPSLPSTNLEILEVSFFYKPYIFEQMILFYKE